jgi:hypothetical protein
MDNANRDWRARVRLLAEGAEKETLLRPPLRLCEGLQPLSCYASHEESCIIEELPFRELFLCRRCRLKARQDTGRLLTVAGEREARAQQAQRRRARAKCGRGEGGGHLTAAILFNVEAAIVDTEVAWVGARQRL